MEALIPCHLFSLKYLLCLSQNSNLLFVYILESVGLPGNFYIGSADNLRQRLRIEMTALDDIREIEREASAFDRKLVRALIEESANRIEERIRGLRDTLLDAPGEIIAFYKMTDLLTRRMTTENAVTVWKKTRRMLLARKKEWENVEKFDGPEIDGIVVHYCKILGDLAAKAAREHRSYAETAHLLNSPANASRLSDALYETASGRAKEMTLDQLAIRSGVRS